VELHIEYIGESLENKPLFRVTESSGNISCVDTQLATPNEIIIGDLKISLNRGFKWYLEDCPQLSIEEYRAHVTLSMDSANVTSLFNHRVYCFIL